MWTGKTTPELKKLNEEYYKMFNMYPWGYEEVIYGQRDYKQYIKDIKEAMETKRELPEIVDERIKEIYGEDIFGEDIF